VGKLQELNVLYVIIMQKILVNSTMKFLLTLTVLGLAVFGMAIGVIFTGKSIHNTCSGSNNCTVCRGGSDSCKSTSDHTHE